MRFLPKLFTALLSVSLSFGLTAQELESQVVVNADLVDQTNRQIFETLEQSLNEFINSRTWTQRDFLPQERIKCSFVLTLTSYSDNRFEGNLQIQSQRPIFDSNYDSPLFNYLDNDISFTYQEYQPLVYNPAIFQSNLVSLLSFYIHIILGLDAASFEKNGGANYFDLAQKIANLAQQSKLIGWNQNDGIRNRFWLIDSLRSNTFREYRQALYQYHREGMDQMVSDPMKAKESLVSSIETLYKLYSRRPNAFLLQVFFDAKAGELVDVFTGGPRVGINNMIGQLRRMAPFFNPQWKEIKF
ncbi:MAG: DUF4835 family protein [Flavobacteriaceae bacterium]|jgi:hypothetical protein|nr:DUF4835 family protein [Flavobacteriales bacterium]MDG1270950.1 DUF4835 family protein [Flavobacteriaceae bacterium]